MEDVPLWGDKAEKYISVKSNAIKRLLREGRQSFGTWLSLGDLFASRVLARLGFDWLRLDLEHWPIDWSQAALIFGAIADGWSAARPCMEGQPRLHQMRARLGWHGES